MSWDDSHTAAAAGVARALQRYDRPQERARANERGARQRSREVRSGSDPALENVVKGAGADGELVLVQHVLWVQDLQS